MSLGLIALLDDVIALAKLAAASLDDAAAQAGRASVKAAGIVVDDTAVTPRYVVGFAAERELPIVGKIALGSLRNKLLFLLPAAAALSLFAPWAITPLLMLGGLYLCFEGAEKVAEALGWHHGHHEGEGGVPAPLLSPEEEDRRVKGAIRTDLILSAEIMAITLASVATSSLWMQVFVLAFVGIAITVVVYGAVAAIVKADDVGVAMAQRNGPVSGPFGRALVYGMPGFLRGLAALGTAAMLWVGGGIILHGLETYHLAGPAHAIHALAEQAGHALGGLGGIVAWLVSAAGAGLVGLVLGGLTAVLVQRLTPAKAQAAHARPGP